MIFTATKLEGAYVIESELHEGTVPGSIYQFPPSSESSWFAAPPARSGT